MGQEVRKKNFILNFLILCENIHKISKLGRNRENHSIMISLVLVFFLMTINIAYALTFTSEQIELVVGAESVKSEIGC